MSGPRGASGGGSRDSNRDDRAADVIVVGSGVAGLTTALHLAAHRRVLLVTSGALGSGSTGWAQGGVAAAVGDGDSPRQHAEDTLAAGAWHGDPVAVAALTGAAAQRIDDLIRLGAVFDRAPNGSLALGREGGHRAHRVVHAGGDATGAEVRRVLVAAVRDAAAAGALEIVESAELVDLLVAERPVGRQVTGVVIRRDPAASRRRTLTTSTRDVRLESLPAAAVVLATGGVGGLWPATTNPTEVTGAWLGVALRAGAGLTDLEFVQFHPTALAVGTPVGNGGDGPDGDGAGSRRPLVTEALRGAGATLLDPDGRALMRGVHLMGDLAPRDIVARRIDEVMRETGAAYVLLDAVELGSRRLRNGFPTVWAACRAAGIDPSREPIPVAPAQHFLCGGVRVDSTGASALPGLYAVGECAATGVHGANRLASNSLLEGLVFGRRVAARLAAALPEPVAGGTRPAAAAGDHRHAALSPADLRAVMGAHVGIRREATGMAAALDALTGDGALAASTHPGHNGGGRRLADQALGAAAVALAAATRQESRGCHWREDHPASDPAWERARVEVRATPDGLVAVTAGSAARKAG